MNFARVMYNKISKFLGFVIKLYDIPDLIENEKYFNENTKC